MAPTTGNTLAAAAFLVASAASAAAGDPSLLDAYNLRVRDDIRRELNSASHGEFAPREPEHHRAVRERMLARQRQQLDDGHDDRRHLDECVSPLIKWSTEQVYEMGYGKYKQLYDNRIISMPYVYKHYVDKSDLDHTEFFVTREQTDELQRRHRDTISFWRSADIDDSMMTDDILLLSMHGTVLRDMDKLVPTITRMFDFDDMADVLDFANEVQSIVESLPGGYQNSLLTMNAVATRSTYRHGRFDGHEDESRRVKDSIIIGDGVLKFLYDSGLESSGPDFVHAHEFGHHLQFRLDMSVPPGAGYEHDDRRKELMADAISGYFLAHDMGGDMVAEEIGIFDETAFSTGDCAVTSDDHHGTPSQRRCAAVWGASLAAPDHVPVLDPVGFVAAFNAAYGGILALDQGACTLVLEEESLDYAPAEEEEEEEVLESALQDFQWGTVQEGEEEEEEEEKEEEEMPKISILDWLDGKKKEHDNLESQGEGDPSNTAEYDPSSPAEVDDRSEHSLESRGKPSSSYSSATKIPGYHPSSSSSSSIAKQSYMKQVVSVHDCDKPWVYCQPSGGRRVHGDSGTLFYISLAATAAFSVIFSWS